ncbi:GNAT family N-acetyltransferase [Actinokineospora inagensis]|uniref:GNAT family N-acetyltransferase n=1 Tax=Actinokineospora inagensis TaxID=103730 RepID=UPI000404133A|nr:GNAT family N-acetyltransferase [Actinokineospora inagensis]
MDTFTVRNLTADEIQPSAALVARAFLWDHNSAAFEAKELLFTDALLDLGAFAGDRQVGATRVHERPLALPGTGPVPIAAVSAVAVASDFRRRGVLRAMLREALPRSGPAVSALFASESVIYGRFGYGVATEQQQFTLPAKTPFQPDVHADSTAVRELTRDEAMPLLREKYDRYARERVGALGRVDANWGYHFHDTENTRRGRSAFRFAVHPEGYAAYRVTPSFDDHGPAGKVSVYELVANSPAAYTALWRYLLDLDLVTTVDYAGSPDEPLTRLLPESRVALRKRFDALHVRLVDVAEALPLRGYLTPVDVVVEVVDAFCRWNEGRWRLTAADGRMTVTQTEQAADLTLDVRELGAAYLGGARLSAAAAAGLVQEHTAGAVAALSNAMLAEREPVCTEIF